MHLVAFDIGVKNFAMAWIHQQENTRNVRHMSLVDLTTGSNRTRWAVYRRLIHHLERFDAVFSEHRPVVLIEQQMASKHRSNIQALRLSQHLLAYFLHRHPSLEVVEYAPRFKTNVFSFSDTSYRGRKKWAVEKTKAFLEDDPVAMDWFDQFRKQDDVADCILMCAAYLQQHGSCA